MVSRICHTRKRHIFILIDTLFLAIKSKTHTVFIKRSEAKRKKKKQSANYAICSHVKIEFFRSESIEIVCFFLLLLVRNGFSCSTKPQHSIFRIIITILARNTLTPINVHFNLIVNFLRANDFTFIPLVCHTQKFRLGSGKFCSQMKLSEIKHSENCI